MPFQGLLAPGKSGSHFWGLITSAFLTPTALQPARFLSRCPTSSMPLELAPTFTHSSHYKNPLLALLSATKAEELKGIIVMEIKDLETYSHRLPWSEPSLGFEKWGGGLKLGSSERMLPEVVIKRRGSKLFQARFYYTPFKSWSVFC